jgi:hypothetical protein
MNVANGGGGVKINVERRLFLCDICNMENDRHFGLRLKPAEYKALADAAAEEKRTISNLVRKIITDWLAARAAKETP